MDVRDSTKRERILFCPFASRCGQNAALGAGTRVSHSKIAWSRDLKEAVLRHVTDRIFRIWRSLRGRRIMAEKQPVRAKKKRGLTRGSSVLVAERIVILAQLRVVGL